MCEFCPVCDYNPLLLLTMILPFPPALPSPCMMQPIWRCTTSASPLCPSWLTASWSSTSLWTVSWITQPSIGTSRKYLKKKIPTKMFHSSLVTDTQKYHFLSTEILGRMKCCDGDVSCTGLCWESSMACSSSLVSGVCSATQHSRTMARFDPNHFTNE